MGPKFALPKTVDESLAMNYIEYYIHDDYHGHGDYDDHHYRFISPELDKILIFDKNENIAGMHSIFPVSASAKNRSLFDYSKSGWYRRTSIDGVDYYMTTAYFMNPSEISTVGRTSEDVDSNGIVRQLYFQVGNQLLEAPMNLTSNGKNGWHFHVCFPTMGSHYDLWNPNNANTISCDDIPPVRLIYHQEVLHDFQWVHVFNLTSVIPDGTTHQEWLEVNPWEPLSEAIANMFLNPPPSCLMGEDGVIQNVGLHGQHVYFRDWKTISCP